MFEIPLKYKDSKIKFNYVSLGKKVMVNLNPTLINNNSKKFNYNISDRLEFKDSLSSVRLKINSYEIIDKYKIDISLEEYKILYQYRSYETGKISEVAKGKIDDINKWAKVEKQLLDIAEKEVDDYEKKFNSRVE